MKKLKNLKGFTLGFLACAIIMSFVIPALAANLQKQATLTYRDIKITLDGNAITPKDTDGNATEPFIIDGTTYLPVRGIASALGLGVDWDNATSTVKLKTEVAPEPTATPSASGDVVYNKDGLKITYNGIDKDPLGGSMFAYGLNFLIENNTGKDIFFSSVNLSINGLMATIFNGNLDGMKGTITSGKSSNSTLYIYNSTLEDNNISEVKEIAFALQYAESDGLEVIGITSVITVKP